MIMVCREIEIFRSSYPCQARIIPYPLQIRHHRHRKIWLMEPEKPEIVAEICFSNDLCQVFYQWIFIPSFASAPRMGRSEDPVLRCIRCGTSFGIQRKKYTCDRCGALLEVDQGEMIFTKDSKFRGVWAYRELIHRGLIPRKIISRGEGSTMLYRHPKVSDWAGVPNLFLKHEGENPTGSFKDRGMTVAVSEALRLGATETICASTGNTSTSAASYSALAGISRKRPMLNLPAACLKNQKNRSRKFRK